MTDIVNLDHFPARFDINGIINRTDQKKIYKNTGTYTNPAFSELGGGSPSGSTIMFPGLDANIPIGWLKCDGRSLARATYPDLFAAIGYLHGGAGSNFNLPDFLEKFPRGAATDDDVGDTGGVDSVILTIAQMPSHRHQLNNPVGQGGGGNRLEGYASDNVAKANTSRVGSGDAHENRPPYITVNYIIKT